MVHFPSFPKMCVLGMSLQRAAFSLKLKKGASGKELRATFPEYIPRGANQEQYVKWLENKNVSILVGIGPAGSGKTLFACNAAVAALKTGAVDKIVMTRPVVPVEEEIGFLPGDLNTKMNPWTRPIFDILAEFYVQKDIDAMLQSGVIEISPLAFMRGRTFKRAFVVADEMQNSSPNQMLMLTTRLGSRSKLVITGDVKQSDRGKENGLAELVQKLTSYGNCDSIKMVEMTASDIERSAAVSKILDIYAFVPGKPSSAVKSRNTFDNDCALIPLRKQ